MIISEAQLLDVEASLTFEPATARRALAARTPIGSVDPARAQRRIAHALGEGAGASDLAVERIVSGGGQLDASYLERGLLAARAVALVACGDGAERVTTTAFLASPRLLVMPAAIAPDAATAARCIARVGFAYDARGALAEGRRLRLVPDECFHVSRSLGIAIGAVCDEDGHDPVAETTWLVPSAGGDLALRGEPLSTVHHPGGAPRQLALREHLLIGDDASALWYATEGTAPAVGAPLFNDSWQVVAVHRGGVAARDARGRIITVDGSPWSPSLDESRIVWRCGTGTRVDRIVAELAAECADHPLVAELLEHSGADAQDAVMTGRPRRRVAPVAAAPTGRTVPPPAPAAARSNGTHAAARGVAPNEAAADAVTVTVPLRITVRAGAAPARGAPAIGVDLS